MTRDDAKSFCESLGLALPQPRSIEENEYYAKYIKKFLKNEPQIRNDKDMRV